MENIIRLYSRTGCCLCEDAEMLIRDTMERLKDTRHLQIVDIDQLEDNSRWTVRVPVLEVNNREVAELQISREEIEAALS